MSSAVVSSWTTIVVAMSFSVQDTILVSSSVRVEGTILVSSCISIPVTISSVGVEGVL